jgi:hypothetical protein
MTMRRRTVLASILCFVVATAALILQSPQESVAGIGHLDPGKCQVGKPSRWHTARFGFGGGHVKFFSPVLVLACGSTGFLHEGSLEIVGYNTSEGLCTSAQVPKYMLFGGLCWPEGVSWQDLTSGHVYWNGAGWGGGGPKPSATNLAGYVDSEATSVEIRFRRDGKLTTKAATLAHIEGELMTKLKASEPLGVFAALLPGCVPPGAINVVARGPHGELLGSQRGKNAISHFCHFSKG